jgi:hypothetical protein
VHSLVHETYMSLLDHLPSVSVLFCACDSWVGAPDPELLKP